MDHVAALQKAIEIAGSQAELARRIAMYLDRPTVSQQTISRWLTKRTRIEAEWWPAIESATDGAVTRRELRPDVFNGKAA